MRESAGARSKKKLVPRVLILLTDGKSSDEVRSVLGNQMGQFHISWDSYLIPWDKMG